MTVTELAFLPSATPGEVPAAYLREGTAAIEAQDQWCAENFPPATATTTTTDPEGEKPHWHRSRRGAALYQQREDAGAVLVTAHWASVEQHFPCPMDFQSATALMIGTEFNSIAPVLDALNISAHKTIHRDSVEVKCAWAWLYSTH